MPRARRLSMVSTEKAERAANVAYIFAPLLIENEATMSCSLPSYSIDYSSVRVWLDCSVHLSTNFGPNLGI